MPLHVIRFFAKKKLHARRLNAPDARLESEIEHARMHVNDLTPLVQLPDTVLLRVLLFSLPADVVAVSQTCRRLRHFVEKCEPVLRFGLYRV